MKNYRLLALYCAIFVSVTAFGQTKSINKPKVEIYYFHTTHRCPTCLSIEENTKNVLNTYYKKEMDAGTLKLYILCSDDSKNKALVDKYGAYGSTLILQTLHGKNEIKDDLTSFAFQYSRNNPKKFNDDLKEKISIALKYQE